MVVIGHKGLSLTVELREVGTKMVRLQSHKVESL